MMDYKFNEAVEKKDYKKAMHEMNRLWLDSMIYLTQLDQPDLPELNYINVKVDTGDGEYILAFMNTSGKKIQLTKPPTEEVQ